MTFKSLLTTVMVAGASISAYAFPTITVSYPTPGATYNSAQYFDNITLGSTEEFSIVSDCKIKPYFENSETGNMVACTKFEDMDFYGDLLHKLEFDSQDFKENGEWVLTLPSGCFKDAAGNFNEKDIEFQYVLADPNLGLGEYPQITLISSNPANGASLPYWGEYVGKVTFKTSDDAAVNYIDWFLWDITYGEDASSRVYIRQGNESRIDVNRTFGDDSDQWENGLFINVGGANEKLIEGHTYRLALKFCGIGYDPATNQYPTPQQQEASLELETYIDFKGQSKGTEYSPYVVESVMPDPEEYEIDNLEMGMFTVTYSGPVKPTTFVYSQGQGIGTASAGTFEPASEPDAAGYATAWDFKFDESLLKGSTGTISVTIEAVDADGLPVKGNGGYSTDDFEYHMDWTCNLGADVLVSVDPANGETVKSLSSITITTEAKKEMNLAYLTIERPFITKMGRAGEVSIDLGEPVFSEDGKQATWTFDPITISGTYSLIIPKNYFIIGSEMMTTYNNQTSFVYIVEGDEPPHGSVTEDLEPVKVSIEDNETIDGALDSIVLTFADVTYISFDPIVAGSLYRENPDNKGDYLLVEEVEPVDNDFFNPTEYTYTFTQPVTEPGDYKFSIPARAFFDGTYDETGGEEGHASPELVYNFKIKVSGVESVEVENGVATVYDIAGRVILSNADAAQIKALAAGVYIINGKKYVVK
ncbi:MAG: hypothetical protein K2N05_06830 [Muribaculaceae bacterium]|nr:hypothetical protein [Muribaculaceae bacterium]